MLIIYPGAGNASRAPPRRVAQIVTARRVSTSQDCKHYVAPLLLWYCCTVRHYEHSRRVLSRHGVYTLIAPPARAGGGHGACVYLRTDALWDVGVRA